MFDVRRVWFVIIWLFIVCVAIVWWFGACCGLPGCLDMITLYLTFLVCFDISCDVVVYLTFACVLLFICLGLCVVCICYYFGF